MTIQATITHIDDEACQTFQRSFELVGKRWSASILLAMSRGAIRFSEITEIVTGLSDRLLAQRIKELEQSGLVAREVIATTPVQIRYRLTERGADLMEAMQPISDWGHRWGV